MTRHANTRSIRARQAAWIEAFGLSEHQVEVLAALVTARILGAPLGCEPATRTHMLSLGLANGQLERLPQLEKAGLIECVAMTAGYPSERWWMATDRACRLLGVTPPARVCGSFDLAAYEEERTGRALEIRNMRTRERYERVRRSA